MRSTLYGTLAPAHKPQHFAALTPSPDKRYASAPSTRTELVLVKGDESECRRDHIYSLLHDYSWRALPWRCSHRRRSVLPRRKFCILLPRNPRVSTRTAARRGQYRLWHASSIGA